MWKLRANSPAKWKRRIAYCLALLLILGASPLLMRAMGRAERHESRHEIDQLEEAWRNAVLHRDATALNNLLAEDYIAITANGTLQSRDETLASLRSGTVHFDSITFSDRKVRFYGTTALVTSRAEISGGTPHGDISGSYRYTHVWVRNGHGTWHIVSFEASRIRGHKTDQIHKHGKH
jgi:ketosteroid isomerase-like protein